MEKYYSGMFVMLLTKGLIMNNSPSKAKDVLTELVHSQYITLLSVGKNDKDQHPNLQSKLVTLV